MTMKKEKEIRNVASEVRFSAEEGIVEGYAMLFDVQSDGLPFYETIERGALDGVVERSDVFALLNHSLERGVLARSNRGRGSLSLEVDERGLKYRFTIPDTAIGRELAENLRRGEIDSSSFGFTVDEDKWEKRDDGIWSRRIIRIAELFDVSPVYRAAYSATSVSLRGRERAEAELREREQRAVAEYLDRIEQSLNI